MAEELPVITEKRKDDVNLFRQLDTSQKIMIIGFVIFLLYVVLVTQKVPNYVKDCTYNYTTCEGYVPNGTSKCCVDKALYPYNSEVPKRGLSWTHAIFGLVLFFAIIISILKKWYGFRELSERDALRIAHDEVMWLQRKRFIDEGDIIIGPPGFPIKKHFNYESMKPFKWLIGGVIKGSVDQYIILHVKAFWTSNKPEDHFLGYVLVNAPMTGTEDEFKDVIWRDSFERMKEKDYLDHGGRRS